ncbi:MAG: hypothetical protein D6698_09275, partial [Gammaproteobacteria bacterium]
AQSGKVISVGELEISRIVRTNLDKAFGAGGLNGELEGVLSSGGCSRAILGFEINLPLASEMGREANFPAIIVGGIKPIIGAKFGGEKILIIKGRLVVGVAVGVGKNSIDRNTLGTIDMEVVSGGVEGKKEVLSGGVDRESEFEFIISGDGSGIWDEIGNGGSGVCLAKRAGDKKSGECR